MLIHCSRVKMVDKKLYRAIAPVYKVSRVFGNFPSSSIYKESKLDLTFTLLRIGLVLLLTIFGEHFCSINYGNEENLIIAVKYLTFLANIAFSVFINIYGHCTSEETFGIILKLDEIDNQLRKNFKTNFNYKRRRNQLIFILILEILLLLIVYYEHIFYLVVTFDFSHFCYFFCQFLSLYLQFLAIFEFMTILLIIRQSFLQINNIVKNKQNFDLISLILISKLHRNLCILASKVNDIHNIKIMLKMLLNLISLLFNIYICVVFLFYGKYVIELEYITLWTFHIFVELIIVTYICTSVCKVVSIK